VVVRVSRTPARQAAPGRRAGLRPMPEPGVAGRAPVLCHGRCPVRMPSFLSRLSRRAQQSAAATSAAGGTAAGAEAATSNPGLT
jgi:hypothetical protein